jgi:3alpha(or 20beta)-hydroxysteroid dehydrogenase
MMGQQLHNKVAIITGAAGGQGAAEARLFIEQGAQVMLTDFNAELGRRTAADLGQRARFTQHDVSSESDWAAVIDATLAEFGRLDILVNNAGILVLESLEESSAATMDRLYRVNQLGPYLGMIAVVPHLKAAGGGSIVNISSLAGLQGQVGATAYSGTKWAVRGMTKSAALELGVYGIRVNSVHPGTILTPMTAGFMPDNAATQPYPLAALNRLGQVGDIAPLVAFLASDAAGYITGSEFAADGGSAAGNSAVLAGILNSL